MIMREGSVSRNLSYADTRQRRRFYKKQASDFVIREVQASDFTKGIIIFVAFLQLTIRAHWS